MKFEIIHAKNEHLDFVTQLFNDYRVYYEQEPDLQRASNFIKARLSREDSVIFLALSNESDMKIALGFTQLYPSFSSVSTKRLWILNESILFTSNLSAPSNFAMLVGSMEDLIKLIRKCYQKVAGDRQKVIENNLAT